MRNHAQRFTIDGVELAAEVQGEGPAVLFVHGYPLSRAIWLHQIAALDGWRRIAPDLRGMGESEAPPGGYRMAAYADDLAGLLDVLEVDSAVLAGLSMGGYVALEFLRRWPSRVRGLVLMDTRAEADSADGRQARAAAAAKAREVGAGAIASEMLPKMLAPHTIETAPGTGRWLHALMAATPVPGLVGALEAMRDRPDSTPLLDTIEVPTLVMVGEHDAITPPEHARAMARAIRGAELRVIPGAGHLPPVERPEATTEAIRDFLASAF